MNKSLVFNIETQTQNDEILSLCFINENTLALETSEIARKMFRLNRALFNKINGSTKMMGGTLYRNEITRPKHNTNRLQVKIDNRFTSREIEISKLFFDNNILKNQQRAITSNGRKIDFDPNMLKGASSGNFLDSENLTFDDIQDMNIVCSIEEISLFEDQGVKAILITDRLEERRSLLKVAYRLELNVDTDFKEYLDLIIERLTKSIKFLTQYISNINNSSHYDSLNHTFKPSFSTKILSSLGLSPEKTNYDLSSQTVKQSDYGQAAINYYNALLLLGNNVGKEIYGQTLRSLLPTSKTTPEAITETLNSMSRLLSDIKGQYKSTKNKPGSNKDYSKINRASTKNNLLEVISTESFDIEKEKLGYSIFSSKQSGLNEFSTEGYKTRYVLEQMKYYPKIQLEDAGYMTPDEKNKFSRLDNQPSFLTPVELILPNKKITTNRGMKNINPNDIRQFRLAKSARAQSRMSEAYPTSTSRSRVSGDIMSKFNIQIGNPRKTLLSRPTEQQIDPLVGVEYYVGNSSTFATISPISLSKSFKRIMSQQDKRVLSIVSDIVPRRFLRQEKAVKSIKDLQISNPKSLIRSNVTAQSIDLTAIPPQVKYMCTPAFNPNPQSDPLKNAESREIIEETQKNLFLIRAHVGFHHDNDGLINVHSPIYVPLDITVLQSGKPILAKAYGYEVPELGIVKDKFSATIYSNLIYIRG
jgi:hypothetical protein